MRRELQPPAYMLHKCAEPGCPKLALAARCDAHQTDDDRARLAAMHDATLRAAHAEEAWLGALREALNAERAAGVRRIERSA
ncbi:hypothetical protein [Candidatus Solirubrobacter pratensis]|uniref:hypothetical protein n=1 Tax=Candidatus Solirubrobacter pratensis TaxID=1298857 RepID=UPI00041D6C74|nr:hypothetical protein [Candidatus Solirubrobacter pratensis]